VQRRQIKAALTWGTDFAGGDGHLILSGDHTWSNDPVFNGQARGYDGGAIVQNPAATGTNGLPYYIHVRNTGISQYAQGGLITGNTAGGVGGTVTPGSLRGIQFIGNGTPAPFNFGTIDAAHPATCYDGCSNDKSNNPGSQNLSAVPYHASTFFGYLSYKLTPDIKASLQINYGKMGEQSNGGNRTTTINIPVDNAYLPASIATQFGVLSNGYDTATGLGGTAAKPIQTIQIGTKNSNNVDFSKPANMRDACSTVGMPCLWLNRVLSRAVFTLEGQLGDNWSWNAYVQHSQSRQRQIADQDSWTPFYNFAVDAVKVTPTNQGTSGLPIGSIQCRALLDPATAAAAARCQPLNLFGNGVASQAAITYVNPGKDPNSGILNQELIVQNQDVFSASMQGKLPWGLPAGDIAVAFGAEYRHEQGAVTMVDPNNLKGSYSAGNFAPYRGQYAVKEAFAEADIPLVEDQIVQSASFNAAARVTDYSTSGVVETWKLGVTSQVDDNIRLRASWSLDIRAPGIYDLFAPGVVAISQLQYPVGSPNYQAQTAQGGNPNLNPEKAITVSGGVVLTPRWIEGLTLSFDWYSINLHGGIYATGDQTIINRCLQGESVYCSLLLFSPTENGGLKPYRVNSNPINAASISTSGLDFQSDYRTDLFDGMLNLSLVGNYTDQQSQTALGITYDSAGSLGSPLSYASSGLPKLRGTLSATYSQGPWSGTIQTRFFGSAVLTNGVENLPANITRASMSPTGVLTAGVGGGHLLDYNGVDPVAYLDLRLAYQWSDAIQLYSAIDNVTNVPPPTDGSPQTYSVLGRIIRAGIRFDY